MDPYDLYDRRERQYEEPAQYECETCEDTGAMYGLIGTYSFDQCPDCGLISMFTLGRWHTLTPKEHAVLIALEEAKRAIYAWRRAA